MHQFFPGLPVGKDLEGALYGFKQGGPGVWLEGKAGRAADFQRRRFAFLYRVGQSTRLSDNGDGAIFEAVQLVQAARLVAGRHKKHIAARLDFVSEFVVEGDVGRQLFGILLRDCRQKVVVFLIPGAEYDHLQVKRHNLVDNLGDYVQPLLLRKASDKTDQGNTGLRQAALLPEGLFAFFLAAEFVYIVVYQFYDYTEIISVHEYKHDALEAKEQYLKDHFGADSDRRRLDVTVEEFELR